MYVTLVFRTKGTRLTKPTLCLVLLSLAVLVGVMRVTEHRNHWNDVLAGFVTGGAIAAFLVRRRGVREGTEGGRRDGCNFRDQKRMEEEEAVVDGWKRVERQEKKTIGKDTALQRQRAVTRVSGWLANCVTDRNVMSSLNPVVG